MCRYSPIDIFYVTGFHFHPTKRPIAFFIDSQQKTHLLVPYLEHEHTEDFAVIEFVHSYPEYPGIKHPMEYLKEEMVNSGFQGKTVGCVSSGFGSASGFTDPVWINF
ncbi:aminopeptidase P family N-terminal domain-containing protein [Fictibacillus terranigra]|uniref:aminopeptidase P family N-terminal domain-containing protein n=1 Tax=Fictibacillus terranigra TaxID=3058424 RepID=UPI00338FD64F